MPVKNAIKLKLHSEIAVNKFEARSTKFETNSKFKILKFKTKASLLWGWVCFCFGHFFFGH
jgi:hypothetical protein